MTAQQSNIVPIQKTGKESQTDENIKVLDEIENKTVNFIHGVIDFTFKLLILGFYILVKSDGSDEYETVTIHLIKENGVYQIKKSSNEIITHNNRYLIKESSIFPNLEEKWGLVNIKKFLSNPTFPPVLFDSIISIFKHYIDFQNPAFYGLLALWCISTYFAYLFSIFPFIFIFGLKGTGKSKLLELMSYIVFNGQKIVQATEAALCDAMDGMRCTVFFDQCEQMLRKFIGLLADSYKKSGAKRWIIVRKDGERIVREFSGYGPKVFAATKRPDKDLADRGPTIPTGQTDKKLPDLIGDDEHFKKIRGSCYQFLLTNSERVYEIYQSLPSDGTRKSELWRPLEAVARVLDIPETELQEISHTFNMAYGKSIEQPSPMEFVLFHALNDFLTSSEDNSESFEKTPMHILNQMKSIVDKDEHLPSRQWIGKKLIKYSLVESEAKKKKTRDKLMHYQFNRANVINIISRYIDTESKQ